MTPAEEGDNLESVFSLKKKSHHKILVSCIRWGNDLINWSQHHRNYPVLLLHGAKRGLAGRPKGWGAYLRPTAAWQLGRQCEMALSPSPRLKANAFSLNPGKALREPT